MKKTSIFKAWSLYINLSVLVLVVGLSGCKMKPKVDENSLYMRLGGLAPISVVVSDFIDVVVPDPFINKNPAVDASRARVPAAYLKYQVTGLVCSVTGGPCQYGGKNMKDAHSHLNITEAEWDRMVELFVGVLDKHNVPEKEQKELLDIVGSTKADIVMAEAK